MKRVLPDIINNDQTGFLKGRSIGENVRLLNSVISYAEQQNVPGMLLFIDFEKAFDTLKLFASTILSCFIQTLTTAHKIMGGPQNSSSLIEALGKDARFPLILPAFPFILCVEILGNAIRNCDQIKGICVLDSECKISQYADEL